MINFCNHIVAIVFVVDDTGNRRCVALRIERENGIQTWVDHATRVDPLRNRARVRDFTNGRHL